MLRIITPPDEIITVDEAAEFMRADFSDDETTMIENIITASRQWCEEYLRRAIGMQTLELTLDSFPKKILLRPPLISVTSIKYLDSNGDTQTMDASDYRVSANAEPASIIPSADSSTTGVWPTTLEADDAVTIRFVTGYQDGGSPFVSKELPKTIRTAMLMQIADLYANRESQVEKSLSANPTLERLLSTLRLEQGQ